MKKQRTCKAMLRRGDLFRVQKPGKGDPKSHRVFVVVSRQESLNSAYSTAICAPVFTEGGGTKAEVRVDERHGLKHVSFVQCDNLMSLPKAALTQFIGSLDAKTLELLNRAVVAAVT